MKTQENQLQKQPSVAASAQTIEESLDDNSMPDKVNSLERLSLHIVLGNIESQLRKIDESLSKQEGSSQKTSRDVFLEFCKLFFGGWTAFAFLVLIFFRVPMYQAMSNLADKIPSSTEVEALGLKATFEEIADDQGLDNLAKIIPSLSNETLEVLLKGSRQSDGLISYSFSNDSRQEITDLYLPSEKMIEILTDLQEKGLIEIEAGSGDLIDDGTLGEFILELKNKFPGTEEDGYRDDQIIWNLNSPIDETENPLLLWRLSDSGLQAVDLILEAVAKELTQTDSTGI